MDEPTCEAHTSESIELVVRSRPRDLGGFEVRRTLPSIGRRQVGPFTFFDHMGPAEIAAGLGMDVRPHPHVGLATLTYLFEGEVLHRDSLGNEQAIRPGEVNWMIAGRGIVHSERTPPALRERAHRSHGLQAWVALRREEEEREPAFVHRGAGDLPVITRPGVSLRVVSGDAFGARAPVETLTPTVYVDARLSAGTSLTIPADYEERAVYVVEGAVGCEGATFEPGVMLVLRQGRPLDLRTEAGAHVMLLGGAPLDGPRHLWWNFVASDREAIERAKRAWSERDERVFPKIPGDDADFIPLPPF